MKNPRSAKRFIVTFLFVVFFIFYFFGAYLPFGLMFYRINPNFIHIDSVANVVVGAKSFSLDRASAYTILLDRHHLEFKVMKHARKDIRNDNRHIRVSAAIYLSYFCNREALPVLENALKDDFARRSSDKLEEAVERILNCQ